MCLLLLFLLTCLALPSTASLKNEKGSEQSSDDHKDTTPILPPIEPRFGASFDLKEGTFNLDEKRISTIPMYTRRRIWCMKRPRKYMLEEGAQVVLKSPRFPWAYPPRQNCGWKLRTRNSNTKISVSCTYFRLQNKRRNRCRDVLQLNRDKFCGYQGPWLWVSPSRYLNIRFRSNRRFNFRGFYCTATAVAGYSPPENYEMDCNSCGIPNRSQRIVGGVATEENEYPWQVALASAGNDDANNFFCGGSIINNEFVLTAAHCRVSTSHQVIVGAHEWASPPASRRRVNIQRVINHPKYNDNTFDNDIALVRLAESLDFSNVGYAPVCLPPVGSTDTYAGSVATVSGWGALQYGTSNFPTTLQEVQVDVVTNTLCNQGYNGGITSNMVCAGLATGGKDSCQGDSGGPLSVENNGAYSQIGVVSFGQGCALASHYGVYARVTRYMTWITSHVGTNGVCSQS